MPADTKPKDKKESQAWGPAILSDPEFGENVDVPSFEQILEMDDDEEEREFSKSIAYDFFAQAEASFKEMETALEEKDLPKLSSLGHFLKGSSATLGLTKVKDHCEKIQHLGQRKDEEGEEDEEDDDKKLEKIRKRVDLAKVDFDTAKRLLKRYFKDTD